MKICVVGAGAIGGLMGVDLALSGEDVTFVDVGPQLEAIRRDGLEVRSPDGHRRLSAARATDDFGEAGVQDLVILGLKAHVVPEVAEPMRALLAPHTTVLTVQNGLPWWYFQRHGGELDGWVPRSLDPEGKVTAHVEPERIVGCVAYPAGSIERPGVIRHLHGHSFPLGELDGADTDRAREIAAVLGAAGYKSPVIGDIRSEIWLKLVGVLAFNAISALTHATMVEICREPATRELAMVLMKETESVAAGVGITLRTSLERRLAGAEKVGEHKTSTLQDVEAGRSLEIEALVGSVLEVGRRIGTPTPAIETVYACVRLLDTTLGRRGSGIRAGAAGSAEMA